MSPSVEALIDIANRAIADYGFRQIVLWSPDDIVARWGLSPNHAEVLRGPLRQALDAMPVPVEPEWIPNEQGRVAALIEDALARKRQ